MIKSSAINSRQIPTIGAVAAGLLVLSLIGGGLAVALHVNSLADAFGNQAEMAAPWPMLLLLVVGGTVAAKGQGWRGVLGTLLVAIPCVAGLASIGDDEVFRQGLPAVTYAYQVFILVASAAGLAACAQHLRTLTRGNAVAH